MWKPISLVNLISNGFVSDEKTGHLRKVYKYIFVGIHSYAEFWHFTLKKNIERAKNI
jgi:hypothetical protein